MRRRYYAYMSGIHAPVQPERRIDSRLRLQVFLTQYVRDDPFRAMAVDICEKGIAVRKLFEQAPSQARIVGLELELPGTREIIWAAAESRFDRMGGGFHTSGLRFAAMARKHERLLRDYIHERRERLGRLFGPSRAPLAT